MKKITLHLLLLALAGTPAAAQVTVNPAALDPPAKPAPRPAQSPPAARTGAAKPAVQAPKPAPQAAGPEVPHFPPPAATIAPIRQAAAPSPSGDAPDVPATAPAGANVPAIVPAGAAPAAASSPLQPVVPQPVVPLAAPPPPMPPPPMLPPPMLPPPVLPPPVLPPPMLPPPLAVTTRPAAPPGTVTITADAPGGIAVLAGGLRVTFGGGRADMTQATSDAIRTLARSSGKTANFNVTGLAAANGDDVSAPRRLALSRGLAIRALLINEGIASTRIYVRALGNNAEAIGTAPADRTDIVVSPSEPVRSTP